MGRRQLPRGWWPPGDHGLLMGGQIVWLHAAQVRVRRMPPCMQTIRSTWPAPSMRRCSGYGGQDQSIPLNTVERMLAALKAAGILSQIVVYPDAGHAFDADYRPGYNRPAAEDGWKRLQEVRGGATECSIISPLVRACCARQPPPAWRRPPDSRMRRAASCWEPGARYSAARLCHQSAPPP